MIKKLVLFAAAIVCFSHASTAGTFEMAVFPDARDVAPGTGVEFFIDIAFCDGYTGTVTLTADADPRLVIVFQDSTKDASGGAVMSVITDTSLSSQTYPITITATDGEALTTAQVNLTATDFPMSYDMDAAIQNRDTAIAFLSEEHPEFVAEFGISPEWEWAGYVPYPPLLVVTHYVFLSKDWRMVVLRHNTIPPYDWKRAFLSNDVEGAHWAIEIDTDGGIRQIPCRRYFYYSQSTGGIAPNSEMDTRPRRWLSENYPNPFNPKTTISYELPKSAEVSLKIFNVLGEEVRTVIHERQPSGLHTVVWDGTDNSGGEASTGVYFYRLMVGAELVQTKKLLLLK